MPLALVRMTLKASCCPSVLETAPTSCCWRGTPETCGPTLIVLNTSAIRALVKGRESQLATEGVGVKLNIIKLFNLFSELEVFLRPLRIVRLETQRVDAADVNRADRPQVRRNRAAGRRHKRQRRVIPASQRDALLLGVLVSDLTVHAVATRLRHPAFISAHGCRKLAHLLVKHDQLLVQISSPNCAAIDLARPSVTWSICGSAKSGFAAKCFRTASTSSVVRDEECVTTRAMPSPGRTSVISFALQ